MPTTNWVIWSNEHKSWWRGGSNGYSIYFEDAGRYSFDEAIEIVTQSNAYCDICDEPMEAIMPESCYGSRNVGVVKCAK